MLQSSFRPGVYHATGIGAVSYGDILNVVVVPRF